MDELIIGLKFLSGLAAGALITEALMWIFSKGQEEKKSDKDES